MAGQNMNEPLPPFQTSAETESTGNVQFFDCESLPIAPGTKAQGISKRPTFFHLPATWWLIGAGVITVLLLGMFLGKMLRF
jgi:hypothetical protein